MTPHPLTLRFAARTCEQGAVFFPDHDLTILEAQLHGFDEALAASRQLGDHERFNRTFSRFLTSKINFPHPHSWSQAVHHAYGQSGATVDRFRRLLLLFTQACATGSAASLGAESNSTPRAEPE